MTPQTPEAFADPVVTRMAMTIADRDQTIASLRALLKTKDDEIAGLKRDCSRLQGRLSHAEQAASMSVDGWFP